MEDNAISANLSKIPKAMYRLLERWHPRIGLGVVGWAKVPGNIYYSLYPLAVRGPQDQPMFVGPDAGGYVLTVNQDQIAVPAWAGANGAAHPDQERRELRTAEIVGWWESVLSLEQVEADHRSAIQTWKGRWTLADREAFLFSWNLIGHLQQKHDARVATCGWGDDEWPGPLVPAPRLLAALGCANPLEMFHQVGAFGVCSTGRVLTPTGEVFDALSFSRQGVSTENIVERLAQGAGPK